MYLSVFIIGDELFEIYDHLRQFIYWFLYLLVPVYDRIVQFIYFYS